MRSHESRRCAPAIPCGAEMAIIGAPAGGIGMGRDTKGTEAGDGARRRRDGVSPMRVVNEYGRSGEAGPAGIIQVSSSLSPAFLYLWSIRPPRTSSTNTHRTFTHAA